MVMRTVEENGTQKTVLEPPSQVIPGDRLVFTTRYTNTSAETVEDFVVTNPLPDAIRFTDAASSPLVSVDGGKTWGLLPEMTVRQADGTVRAAQPGDVTHIRWAFQKPIPVGGSGKLMFRGVVK